MSDFEFKKAPGVAANYVSVVEDENGCLQKIDFTNTEHFNFGFDVIDVLAKKCPDKIAMIHIDAEGKERKITFRDMKIY